MATLEDGGGCGCDVAMVVLVVIHHHRVPACHCCHGGNSTEAKHLDKPNSKVSKNGNPSVEDGSGGYSYDVALVVVRCPCSPPLCSSGWAPLLSWRW